MLRHTTNLANFTLQGTDGKEIGRVRDFCFDELAWVLRYWIVETGAWLANRQVLIAPEAVAAAKWSDQVLLLNVSSDMVQKSPPYDPLQAASLVHERRLRTHYGWPVNRGVGFGSVSAATSSESDLDPHLHSAASVVGCALKALDGDIGHVSGFLIDESSWAIRYVELDARNWLPGRYVVMSPFWIDHIDWVTGCMEVCLDRATVRSSPAYNRTQEFEQDDSTALHQHYGASLLPPGSTVRSFPIRSRVR